MSTPNNKNPANTKKPHIGERAGPIITTILNMTATAEERQRNKLEMKLLLDKYDFRGNMTIKTLMENYINTPETKPLIGRDERASVPNPVVIRDERASAPANPTVPKREPRPARPDPVEYKRLKINMKTADREIDQAKITITLDELREEIKNPEFIKSFTESARELMRAKEKVYIKRLLEIKAEYMFTKAKIDRLRQAGTSESTIKELCPGFDNISSYMIDIENVTKLTRERATSINEQEIFNGLDDAIDDPDNGISALMGRVDIKDQIASQLYSFSKGYKTFFGNFNNMVIMGPAGSGKCLHPETPVLMYSGEIKPAREVVVGDRLMGDDSTPRLVKSTCRGRDPMYKITPEHGDPYIVNKPHILSLKRVFRSKVTWDGDNTITRILLDFDGFGVAEESRVYPSALTRERAEELITRYTSVHQYKDISVEKYIKKPQHWKDKWRGYRVPVNFPPNPNGIPEGHYFIDWDVGRLGMEIKTATREMRLFILALIIDRGGSLVDEVYQIPLWENKLIGSDILYVARSCGFVAYIADEIIYIKGAIDQIPSRRFVPLPTEADDMLLLSRLTVEPIGDGEYVGFSIDGNRRFLLGDFTVTHNTRLAKTIAYAFSRVGILARGLIKIATRMDLVGQYIGTTGPRTRAALLDTLEGILFIDEAYQLCPAPQDKSTRDFGGEAITEIVNFLDKFVGLNVVIVAGYEEDMKRTFMSANEGIPRRFPYRYILSAYTVSELTDILIDGLRRRIGEGIIIDNQTCNYIYSIVRLLSTNHPNVFKNQAGDMLNLSTNINNAINSSYRVQWINGRIINNKKILIAGVNDYLSQHGVSIVDDIPVDPGQ